MVATLRELRIQITRYWRMTTHARFSRYLSSAAYLLSSSFFSCNVFKKSFWWELLICGSQSPRGSRTVMKENHTTRQRGPRSSIGPWHALLRWRVCLLLLIILTNNFVFFFIKKKILPFTFILLFLFTRKIVYLFNLFTITLQKYS